MDTKQITRFWILTGIALLTLATVVLWTWTPVARAQTDRQTDNPLYESSAHAGPHRAGPLP